LWDLRKLGGETTEVPAVGSGSLLQEYNKHVCAGYNVGCDFFNGERNVISGSEDKNIFIYDTASGEVLKYLIEKES
jgi:WD40 repeat protein